MQTSTILQGSVFDTLPTIKPGSVDCVVTSPPYWMLRSYLPKGHDLKAHELGSEPTPAAFVETMVKVFRLVRETMADHATCWVNMGDTYASSGIMGDGMSGLDEYARRERGQKDNGPKNEKRKTGRAPTPEGIIAGNLCLIPQRLAIALQDDGWLIRSVVVWHKPAPMPASVSGWMWRRCRVKVGSKSFRSDGMGGQFRQAGGGRDGTDGHTHREATWSDCPGCPKCTPNGGYVLRRGSWRPTSSWEPVLMMAKAGGYYADGEAVKTPVARRWDPATNGVVGRNGLLPEDGGQSHEGTGDPDSGANLRDVWTIASEPLKEKHFASFPTELVYRCLAAGTSSKGYCVTCGKPWARVVESADTIGWRPSCTCPDNTPRPGLVLDPFSGSGRTGIQAQRMGLDYVGCELNPEYVEMSRRLLREAMPLFS